MKVVRLMILAVCSAACLSAPADPGSTSGTFPASTKAALNQALKSVQNNVNSPGMVVCVWMPGKGSYIATRGFSDEKTKKPMSVNDHFRIGSITKTFTVTAILQLADDQKLSLDDPVSKYLSFVPNGKNITLRMLANMTSGLFSYTGDDNWVTTSFKNTSRSWKPRELVDVAFDHPAPSAPGAAWAYVNTNTVLLGMVIEKITGEPVQKFFAKRIFAPLKLKNTYWPTNGDMPKPYACGVTEQTLNGSRADATHRNPSWGFTAGQMISNMADLKVWVKSYCTGSLISPAMQKERLTWVTLPPNTPEKHYGLGIGEANGWLGHTGELPGYNAGAYYLPESDCVIITLFNSDIPTKGKNPVGVAMTAITTVLTPKNIAK